MRREQSTSDSDALQAYLRAISRLPRLSADEERELGRRIQQAGDQEALRRLVEGNLRFVVAYAKRYRGLGVSFLDLIHEGNLGLIEAARRYDPSHSDFQSSAEWWIRQAMMHLLSEAGRTSESTVSGLLAAAAQGRLVDAIRVALEYAQSAAAGMEIKEPPVADAEDFAAHLHDEGRRKTLRKARKRRMADAGAFHVIRQHTVLLGYLN